MRKKVQNVDKINVALAEFDALRVEIQWRSTMQHGLLNLSLVATAALGTIAFSGLSRVGILLLLPIVGSVFGFLYFDHDVAVSRAGDYIREELRPALKRYTGWDDALGWEDYIKDRRAARAGVLRAAIRFDILILLTFEIVPIISSIYLLFSATGLGFGLCGHSTFFFGDLDCILWLEG